MIKTSNLHVIRFDAHIFLKKGLYYSYAYYEYQKKHYLYYLKTAHKFLKRVYLLNKDRRYEMMNNKTCGYSQTGLSNEILEIKNDNYVPAAVKI